MRRLSALLCGSTAVMLSAAVQPAWAQSAQSTTLEEIVVTAQKKEASLQNVPAAVSALGADALQMRGVDSVESLTTQIPNVVWGEQTSASLITIRGVGTSVDTGIAEPNVGIHIDGVYQSRATMATLDLQDMARIEVLRGPQGTLYGRNSTGGAINIISASPTNEFKAEVAASAGNFGQYGVRGYVSGPVSAIAGARVSAYFKHSNGYYTNILTGDDKADESKAYGVRVVLDVKPTETFDANLSAYYQVLDQDKYVGQQLLTPIPGFFVGLGGSAAGVATSTNAIQAHRIAADYPGSNKITTLGLTANLSWQITPSLTLKSVTGYIDHTLVQNFDGDATSYAQTTIGLAPGVTTSNPRNGDAKAISQEFNLSGRAGERFTWLVGAFLFDESFHPDIPAPLPNGLPPAFAPPTGLPAGSIIIQRGEETTKSYAAFTDMTFHVTDRFRISGGLRVSRDEKKFVQTTGVSIPGVPLAFTLACSNAVREKTFESTTPRVEAEFDASKDTLMYVQYAKGFRSGGFNISDCADDFDPERITAVEGGLKTRFADRRGTLNISVFDYDYTGLQIFQINGFTQNIANADAKVRGAEAELAFAPNTWWQFNAAASYLDAKYGNFLNIDPLNPLLGPQQLRGNRLNRAPEYTLSGGAQLTVPTEKLGLHAGGNFRFRAEIYHSAEVFYRPFNIGRDRQGPYTIGNLFAEYVSEDGLGLRAYVKNVGDTEYVAQALANPVEGAYVGHYGPPRTFGLEISKRF
ncbi:MAG: hypothetical protein JWP35_53 [Caulobacter sp.]|nr:hypothetical protein [Caulobacter sp.]